MSRILVSGGAGFIGSHIVEQLLKKKHEVIVLDNFSTGTRDNLFTGALNYKVDIRNKRKVNHYFKKHRPEFVIHTAALARIQPSVENPRESHEVNVNGSLNLLEASRKYGVKKFIFSSTSSLYADSTKPMSETSKIHPKSPYGVQKLAVEAYIRLYQELYGLNYTIFRYFNVFGERQILTGDYAAIVGIFLEQYKNRQKLTITNDGKQRRDFTYVGDVAKANHQALRKFKNETVNLGTGSNISINQLADLFDSDRKYIGIRLGEAKVTLCDNRKAKRLGWKQTVDITDWVKEQIYELDRQL